MIYLLRPKTVNTSDLWDALRGGMILVDKVEVLGVGCFYRNEVNTNE